MIRCPVICSVQVWTILERERDDEHRRGTSAGEPAEAVEVGGRDDSRSMASLIRYGCASCGRGAQR